MGKISRFLDKRLGSTTDSRWGIFATCFSLGWAFLAFAFSLFAVSGGKDIMPSSGWMIAAWVFGIIGIASLVFAILVAIRWLRNPLHNTTPEQLGKMRNDIRDLTKEVHSLVEEIRRERNEKDQ